MPAWYGLSLGACCNAPEKTSSLCLPARATLTASLKSRASDIDSKPFDVLDAGLVGRDDEVLGAESSNAAPVRPAGSDARADRRSCGDEAGIERPRRLLDLVGLGVGASGRPFERDVARSSRARRAA